MRVERVHLRAYGHFTNHTLDFGSSPGFQLVYGPNETGKSTTLRALSSVLFGYPHSVIDNFRHDAKDMAIGVEIVAQDGRRLSYVRKRRGKTALIDSANSPLDESAVAAFLGGASKDLFEKVFALDHRRLREHAQALLAEGGSLGFSLAEAASGIAGLKTLLEKLKKERDRLFLGSGSNPRINALIRKFVELRKEANRRTVSPYEYKRLEKEINAVEETLREARGRQRSLETDVRRLQRIERNLARQAEHENLSRMLDMLSMVPVLPSDAVQRRIKAQSDAESAQRALNQAESGIQTLEAKIAAIATDEGVLAHREAIDRLAGRRALMEERKEHLPRREAELRHHLETARDLLASGELAGTSDNLAQVLPSAVKRKAIETLAAQGAKLIAQRFIAVEQLKKAEKELETAKRKSEDAPKPSKPVKLESALLAADRLGDITSAIAERGLAHDSKMRRLSQSIISLGIAGGDVSALREFRIPAEQTVGRYVESLAAIDREIDTTTSNGDRLSAEIKGIDDRIAEVRTSVAVPSEGELVAVRGLRDQGWVLVRGVFVERRLDLEDQAKAFSPNGRIAESYEQLVGEADRIADTMRLHSQKATEVSLLERDKADRMAKKSEIDERLKAARQLRKELLEQWEELWPPDVIRPQLPREMVEWLSHRVNFLSEAKVLEDERDAIEELRRKELDATASLVETLQTFGGSVDATSTLDAMRDQARELLSELVAANTQFEKAKEGVRAQERHAAQAKSSWAELDDQIRVWEPQWRTVLEVAGVAMNLTPEGGSVVVSIMRELDVHKSRIDDLKRRIGAMQEDLEGFGSEISALAHLAPNSLSDDAVEICRLFEARLKEAVGAESERQNLSTQVMSQISARGLASDSLARAKSELEALCREAGCSEPEELMEVETKSAEKQRGLRERTEIEMRVREDGAGLSFEELFTECNGMNGDEIPGKVADLNVEREEISKSVEELMQKQADLRSEFNRLLAQDQAAEIMQGVANVEAELAEVVESYVQLTLQETLLRRSIDLYRDRNQGPILGRAKELFSALTDGAYTGLRADVDERNQPILLAEHRTRGSLGLDALSDGTIDVLYLALRLAVVQEHNATREALPFIADDLLLNLDNHRAKAAFRTLTKAAESGQVLFFTHHAHMVELARSSVPGELFFEHHLPVVV